MKSGRLSGEMNIEVYLALGSNAGDRETNLRKAIAHIRKLVLKVTRESSLYETEPVGFAEQRWFLNQVIAAEIATEILEHQTPAADGESGADRQAKVFLSKLLNIEQVMGRERGIVNGPRTIDIDLLLFGDAIIGYSQGENAQSLRGAEVCVPHPRMHERRFVLEPLCEIAPGVVHPVLKKTCREMLSSLSDASVVRLYEKKG
jgi:2-amino-4-hydroxy-6-hydroxymethyldihydropteridine diphosphokinase